MINFSRRKFLLGASVAALVNPANAARFPRGSAGQTQQWQNVKIGGGGFVTGIDIATDGTKLIRCDVFGTYIATNASPTWRQLQLGAAFGNQIDQGGPYEAAISKSDSTRIYMIGSDGFLYKSTDTGVTFTKLTFFNGGNALINSFGDLSGNRGGNGKLYASRENGRFLAIDPHDPNVLYVCPTNNLVSLTLDGGTTWQTFSNIPRAIVDTTTANNLSNAVYTMSSTTTTGTVLNVTPAISAGDQAGMVGLAVVDNTSPTSIPAGVTVASATANTITLTGTGSTVTVASGHTICVGLGSLGTAVVIDPAAAPVNGRSPNVYVLAYGSQMFKSTNAGSATPTFASTGGGPTTLSHLTIDSDGTVYVADNTLYGNGPGGGTSGAVWTYSLTGPTWTNLYAVSATASFTTASPNITMTTNPGWVTSGMVVFDVTSNQQIGTVSSYVGTALVLTQNALFASSGSADILTFGALVHAVAADPATAGRVVFSSDGGDLSVSTNHGATRTALALGTKTATDVPWLGVTPNSFFTGDIAFDPSASSLLYLTMGIGVWKTTVPASGTVNWTDQSAGIEELVVNTITASPSYTYPLCNVWDRSAFFITDPNSYPASQFPPVTNQLAITMTWSADYAKSVPGTIAMVTNFLGVDTSGVTTDGVTFTQFGTKPNAEILTTSAGTALGNGVFTFASVPAIISPRVSNIGNRQAMYLGFIATTTAPTAKGGTILHFGGGLPAGVVVGNDPFAIDVPNATIFRSVSAINNAGVTGDVLLDGPTSYAIPTGSRISFKNSALNIDSNAYVTATTGTTVTISGQPTGAALQSGESIMFNSGQGGCIAASTPLNMIWVGANREPFPWYTKDGGATWANVIIGTSIAGFGSNGAALPDANGDTGWPFAYFVNASVAAADSVTANRFLIYNGRIDAASGAGLWESVNSGDTWTQRVSGRLGNGDNQYGTRLFGVPGNAHHFFFSAAAASIGRNNGLFWSTDTNNANWFQIAGVSHIFYYGLGAAAPGKNYPTVYVIGTIGGVASIWRGTGNLSDWQAGTNTGSTVTWTNINPVFGLNPVDWLSDVTWIEGDPSVYGRCYIGRGQASVAMGFLG